MKQKITKMDISAASELRTPPDFVDNMRLFTKDDGGKEWLDKMKQNAFKKGVQCGFTEFRSEMLGEPFTTKEVDNHKEKENER